MWWSHLGWVVSLIAVLDWRRPSTSQLAVAEAELFQVAQLRYLVQELEGSCSGCDWELFWWRWFARVLAVALLGLVIVVLFPKFRAPKLTLELPALELPTLTGAVRDSSQLPTSVATTALRRKLGQSDPQA